MARRTQSAASGTVASARTTLEWAAMPPETTEYYVRRARLLLLICILVSILLALACVAYTVVGLWRGWTTGSWPREEYISFLFILPIFLSTFSPLYTSLGKSSPLLLLAERLTRVLAGDEPANLPLATGQPAPLSSSTLSIDAERIGPLRGLQDIERAHVQRRTGIVWGVIGAFFLVPGLVLLAAGFGWLGTIGDQHLKVILATVGIGLGCLGLLYVWLTARSWRRARLCASSISVTVDASGLRWRETRYSNRVYSVAWSEVRAFLTVPALGGTHRQPPCAAYLVVTRPVTLVWTLAESPTAAEAAASERMCRLVVTYTRLPLRDASALVERFASAFTSLMSSLLPHYQRVQPIPGSEVEDLLSPEAAAWPQGTAMRTLKLTVGVGVLAVGLLFAKPALQQYQSHIYGGLLAQAWAASPLFADTLTPVSTYWALAPTDSSADMLTPSNTGYILSGPEGQTVDALAGPTFSNSRALSVGVAQQFQTDAGNYAGGAGLIVRSSADQQTEVVFYVDGNHDWSLSRSDVTAAHPEGVWTTLASGSSDSIHGTNGAVNTLAVVVRGTSDYCFVNGSLVGFTHSDTTPTSGQVGLFGNDGAVPATFRDFSVYPVK